MRSSFNRPHQEKEVVRIMSVSIVSVVALSVMVGANVGCSSNSSLLTLSEEGSGLKSLVLQSSGSYEEKPLTCREKFAESCPPGLFCEHDGYCKCTQEYPHNNIIIITCNGTRSFLINLDFCATYNEDKSLVAIGSCHQYYERNRSNSFLAADSVYNPLPRYPEELNNMTCNLMRRTGISCGSCRCLPHHYPLAYSYNLTCIPCLHAHWNWFRYIMAAYLPLTLFYFIVVLFKINITTSHLFSVVYYCQTLTMPLVLRNIIIDEVARDTNTAYSTTASILIGLYGVWNLDSSDPFILTCVLD